MQPLAGKHRHVTLHGRRQALLGDHADSCLAYARGLCGVAGATGAQMTGVSCAGFALEAAVEGEAKLRKLLVRFPVPLRHASQVRGFAVELHHAAFAALGLHYRLRHGYYRRGALMAIAGVAKAIAKRRVQLGAVGLAAAALVVAVAARRRVG